jgi:hypothetical protein
MLTDSTQLMFYTFQCARHAQPAVSELLPLLDKVLDTVIRERSFVVEIPDVWVSLFDPSLAAIVATFEARPDASWTSSETAPLFSLVRMATAELRRLHAQDAVLAVRSIGYALHMIPRVLRGRDTFSRGDYEFCFRIISAHWSELSDQMRQAFCLVMGFDLQHAEALVGQPGFALEMYGSAPGPGHRVCVVSSWEEPTDQGAAPTPSLTGLARRCAAFLRRLLGTV